MDAVLTDEKEEIQMQVKSLVTEVLQEYDIGLTLVDVKIQDAEPPTQEVIEAFKAVETAKANLSRDRGQPGQSVSERTNTPGRGPGWCFFQNAGI